MNFRKLTSIIVMNESGNINNPMDATLTFNINLDERSSLDNVSTWNVEHVST